jgi:hypothetical protein
MIDNFIKVCGLRKDFIKTLSKLAKELDDLDEYIEHDPNGINHFTFVEMLHNEKRLQDIVYYIVEHEISVNGLNSFYNHCDGIKKLCSMVEQEDLVNLIESFYDENGDLDYIDYHITKHILMYVDFKPELFVRLMSNTHIKFLYGG